MVASAVLVIFFLATALILQNGIEAIGTARLRGEAIRIAQERLELVRNLAYEQVGTIGGIPAGPMEPEETVSRGDVEYFVRTSVVFVDDPFDGIAPEDILPSDYKRVKVEVTWSGLFASKQPISLLTDVSPRTLEMNENQGTLSFNVLNALGQPISNAEITLSAATLDPPVALTVTTDASGKVSLPGAPTCDACYYISVTKDGYSTERTYGLDEIANPVKPHLSVLEAQVTEASFIIDQLSTLQLTVTRGKANNYAPFAGVSLIIRGTKEIGRSDTDDPIYKIERNVVTGTGGIATVTNLEWDNYEIIMPPLSSVDFAGSWPFSPFSVEPNSTTQVAAVVRAASTHSLLVQVTDAQKLPLGSGYAELSGPGFIATESFGLANKGDWSQAFFGSLANEQYGLTIYADNMATLSSSILVEGDRRDYFIMSAEGDE
jgi:hypothetical protein